MQFKYARIYFFFHGLTYSLENALAASNMFKSTMMRFSTPVQYELVFCKLMFHDNPTLNNLNNCGLGEHVCDQLQSIQSRHKF